MPWFTSDVDCWHPTRYSAIWRAKPARHFKTTKKVNWFVSDPTWVPPNFPTSADRTPRSWIPPRHPVMRSSPDLKVKIPAVAGRSCAGAPWGPCSSQSGASAVGLALLSFTGGSTGLESAWGFQFWKASKEWRRSATDTCEFQKGWSVYKLRQEQDKTSVTLSQYCHRNTAQLKTRRRMAREREEQGHLLLVWRHYITKQYITRWTKGRREE